MILCPIHESNDCHSPAGSPAGGQFCGDSVDTIRQQRAEAMRASAPFEHDLASWKAEQRTMGASQGEVDEAVRQATAVGIDPTKSDDLNDLETYLTATEVDEDFRAEQIELGHMDNQALLTWARTSSKADTAFTAGETVRFDGKAADGTVEGFMDVTVVDPHSNRSKVTQVTRGRPYVGAHSHLPTARVRNQRGREFEAHHHTLRKKKA